MINNVFEFLKVLILTSGIKRTENGFEYQVELNKSSVAIFKDQINDGFPFSGTKIDEQYVATDELAHFIGKKLTVVISSSDLRQLNIFIYPNLENFLSYKPNLLKAPDNFIIVEQKLFFQSGQDDADQRLITYFSICKLLASLNLHADHRDQLTEKVVSELVFLHKSRLEIPIDYSEDCLSFGLDGISVFESIFKDEAHILQKVSILKEVLFSLLINVNKFDRLDFLLEHFGEFSKRFNENYQLFVSEFSFDDVRREYEEKKRDYLVKINDVFASVQTKMLGIPVSLAIIAFKMSTIVDDQSFWTNFVLLFAVVAYAAMMSMLIEGQKDTLTNIKEEYSSHMNRLKHQYPLQFEQIKQSIIDLDKREQKQRKNLNSFYIFGAVLIILTIAFFLFYLPWKEIMGI